MRRLLTVGVIVAAMAAPVPAGAAVVAVSAQPTSIVVPAAVLRPCASYTEYKRVKTNGTQSPAKVQYIFGVKGKVTYRRSWYGRGGVLYRLTVIRYRPTCSGGVASPYVYFRGRAGTVATASAKAWRR